MTSYYCDICHKQLFAPSPQKVLISPEIALDYDLCDECRGAIKEARNNAEIETVRKLERRKNE